jgi:hypothetical protein
VSRFGEVPHGSRIQSAFTGPSGETAPETHRERRPAATVAFGILDTARETSEQIGDYESDNDPDERYQQQDFPGHVRRAPPYANKIILRFVFHPVKRKSDIQ